MLLRLARNKASELLHQRKEHLDLSIGLPMESHIAAMHTRRKCAMGGLHERSVARAYPSRSIFRLFNPADRRHAKARFPESLSMLTGSYVPVTSRARI